MCAFVGMCALPLVFETEFYSFTVKYRIRQFKRKVRAVCSEMAGQVGDSEKNIEGVGRVETGGVRVERGFRKDHRSGV